MSVITLRKSETGPCLPIARQCEIADSFLSRFLGLMFRSAFHKSDALVLEPCTSIHTFFMRFSIDIICVNAQGLVVDLEHGLRPWRCFFPQRGTRSVLELPQGAIKKHNVAIGDSIQWNQ